MSGGKRLEKARRGELRLEEFMLYGQAIGVLIDAEEATAEHAVQVARWQAAGEPASPQHPASEDLLAVDAEARYYRRKLADMIKSSPAELERAVAQHYPQQARCVVIVHARLAKLERRPLKLPKPLGTDSQAASAQGRGSEAPVRSVPAEACRGAGIATREDPRYVTALT